MEQQTTGEKAADGRVRPAQRKANTTAKAGAAPAQRKASITAKAEAAPAQREAGTTAKAGAAPAQRKEKSSSGVVQNKKSVRSSPEEKKAKEPRVMESEPKKQQRAQRQGMENNLASKPQDNRDKKKKPQAVGKTSAKTGFLPSKKEKWVSKESEQDRKKKEEVFKISYIVESLEKANEALQQIHGVKEEYQTVTNYLMDIEKLDQLSGPEKESLQRAAENVRYYEKELEKCKDKDSHISSDQKIRMAKYETGVLRELKNLRDNEEYGRLVKNDLRHLETEKGYLFYERDETVVKQRHLKKIAVLTAVFVFTLFALVAAVAYAFKRDMTAPYLLTILLAAGSGFAIFMEATKNRNAVRFNEKKLLKAISLLNSVKIKYVNNRNLIDYMYEKYDVKSAEELEYNFQQYKIWKEKEEKYQKYTERLLFENQELIKELERLNLSDTEDWIKHAEALVDQREMVEVRHELNVRRQKLRAELDRWTKIYKASLLIVKKAEEVKPVYRNEIHQLLKQYGIDTSVC